MRRELWQWLAAGMWCFILPVAAEVAHAVMRGHWVLQLGPQQYIWGAVLAVVWYAGLWMLWPNFGQLQTLKFLPLWLFGAFVFITSSGYAALCLANSVGDDSEAQVVDVRLVARFKQWVRFAVVSGPQTGIEFECSASSWGQPLGSQRRLVLRRGRLGIFWGRLERVGS